jgi:hypothetical protein
LAAIGAIGAAALATAPGATAGDSLVWRLNTPDVFTQASGWQREALAYTLPKDAQQGQGAWYRIRFELTFDLNGSKPGYAIVAASTNQIGAMYVQVRRRLVDGRPQTRWFSEGFLQDDRSHLVSGRTFVVDYENFLPYPGVKGGGNRLTLTVEQHGSPVLRRVALGPSSAIVATRAGPARLVVSASGAPTHTAVAHRWTEVLTIRNRGGSPGAGILVTVSAVPPIARLTPTRLVLHTLAPGGVARRTVHVVADKRGTLELHVRVDGVSNQASATQRTQVG